MAARAAFPTFLAFRAPEKSATTRVCAWDLDGTAVRMRAKSARPGTNQEILLDTALQRVGASIFSSGMP
jgi:hypothetical protein